MINNKGLQITLYDGSSKSELEKAIKKLRDMIEDENFERKDFHETTSQKKRRKRKKNKYLREKNAQ